LDIWKILQTEPTRDKDALKRAYRKKLVTVHPEDDPEGFRMLREAYEKALELADSEEEAPGGTGEERSFPDTPRGAYEKAMHDIYASFFRRVSINEWETLLSGDYAASIETAEEAMLILLDFIMEHYNLPHQVYLLICRHYDLNSRREELLQRYPIRFLDFIISNATYPDAVDETRFEGPEDYDYDGLIGKIGEFARAVKGGDDDVAERLLPELTGLPVRNPELEVLLARYDWQRGKKEEAMERLISVEKESPDDTVAYIIHGDLLLHSGRTEEAGKMYRKARALEPDTPQTRGRMGELAIAEERFEDARDIFYSLLKDQPYDGYLRAATIKACEGIVDKLEKEMDKEPDNASVRIKLATALYQSYRFEKALEILADMEIPGGIDGVNYHNYRGRSLLSLQKAEQGEEEIRLWISGILGIPASDESEEAVAARKRMGYAVTLLGVAMMMQGRYDEARKELLSAVSSNHEEILVTLEEICMLDYLSGNYQQGIRSCIELEQRSVRNYQASNIRAKCAFKLGLLQEAVDYAERAVSIYPFFSEPYMTLADVMIKEGDYREAGEIAARFETIAPESDAVPLIRAKIAAEESGDWKKVRELLLPVKEHVESGRTDIEHKEEYYILLGEASKYLDDPRTALESFETAVSLSNNSPEVLEKLGDMHRRLLHFEEALSIFEKQEALMPTGRVLMNQAYCLMQLGRFQEAREKLLGMMQYSEEGSPLLIVCARMLLKIGCPGDAAEALDRMKEPTGETRADYVRIRMRVLIQSKNYAEAESFLKSLDDTERSLLAEENIELLILTGRFADAVRMAEESSWKKENISRKYDLLSEAFFYSSDLNGLEKLVKEAKQLQQEGEDAATAYQYELLGRLQLLKKQYSAAEQSFLTAVDKEPVRRYRYLGYMAECAARQFGGKTRMLRYLASLEHMETSCLPPVEAKIRLAQGLRAGKTYARAHRLLEEVLNAFPWYEGTLSSVLTEAYEELGWLYLAEKKKERALLAFETARSARGIDNTLSETIKRLRNDSRN